MRYLSAWNEPNHFTQPFNVENPVYNPTGGSDASVRARRARARAALMTYTLERHVCKHVRASGKGQCTVLAGEFLQKPNGEENNYASVYRKDLDGQFDHYSTGMRRPTIWALHPYQDVDKRRSYANSRTKGYLAKIPSSASVWFTEVGAIVTSPGRPAKTFAQQDSSVDYLIDDLATGSADAQARIKRVYYYNFCPVLNTAAADAFDTSLYNRAPFPGATPSGSSTSCLTGSAPRPAFATFQRRASQSTVTP